MLTVHRVICVSLFDVRNFATIFKERNSEVRLFFFSFLLHKGSFTSTANLEIVGVPMLDVVRVCHRPSLSAGEDPWSILTD